MTSIMARTPEAILSRYYIGRMPNEKRYRYAIGALKDREVAA
jgi:hypothetical protein